MRANPEHPKTPCFGGRVAAWPRLRSALLTVGAAALLLIGAGSAQATSGSDTALLLSGSGQYASSTASTFSNRTVFTIETWSRASATACAGACTIVGRAGDAAIAIRSGTYHFIAYWDSAHTDWVDSDVPAPVDQWVHTALVRDGATVTLLINGIAVQQRTLGANTAALYPSATYPFRVGYQGFDPSYFSGQVDEVRYWSTARTAAQIQTGMHEWGPSNATGLIGYWDFNDMAGSTVENRAAGAAAGTDLTVLGSPTTLDVKQVTRNTTTGKMVVTFPRTYITQGGGWEAPTGVSTLDYLVVGGGGGGGGGGYRGSSSPGGGGGGGGAAAVTSATVAVTAGAVYRVVAGAGGIGGPGGNTGGVADTVGGAWGGNDGDDGGTSAAFGGSADGGYGGCPAMHNVVSQVTCAFATWTETNGGYGGNSRAGRAGGGPSTTADGGGGGGGGSTAVGAAGSGLSGGAGGAGTSNAITGSSLAYATGGVGGAGTAGSAAGTSNTSYGGGGGGGGGAAASGALSGGSGAMGTTGAVIVAYDPPAPSLVGYDFNTLPANVVTAGSTGNPRVSNGQLFLTTALNSQWGTAHFPINASGAPMSWRISFYHQQAGGSGADGTGLWFAPRPASYAAYQGQNWTTHIPFEDVAPATGLAVQFEKYTTGRISLYWNGALLHSATGYNTALANGSNVTISYDANGLDFSGFGLSLTDRPLANYASTVTSADWVVSLGGNTGGANDNQIIDDLMIRTNGPGVALGANRSRVFNGTSDFVGIPDHSYPDDGSFTFEGWVKRDATQSGTGDLIRKVSSFGYSVNASGQLEYAIYTGSTWLTGTDTSSSLPAGTWTHVAIVKDGAALRIYRNGNPTPTATIALASAQVANNLVPTLIGKEASGCPETASTANTYICTGTNFRYFKGSLDAIRIWDGARTGAQIAQYYRTRLAADVLTLNFDEPSGTVAFNATQTAGQAYDASLAGTTLSTDVPAVTEGLAVTAPTAVSGYLPFSMESGSPTFSRSTQAVGGTMTVTNADTGAFTYTPTRTDSFLDTFAYTVSNSVLTALAQTITVDVADVTAPTVSSFTSAETSPTSSSSFSYTLTFSESVTGVAAADFTNTGTAQYCSFAPGTDSGSTRTVTITGCGNGTVIPKFAASGATDAAGNNGPAADATATTTVTVALVPPSSTASVTATRTGSTAISVDYTVTAQPNGVAVVKAYASSAANLSSPVECGSATSTASTGTIACTLPSATATYRIYTRAEDSRGTIEAVPGSADDTIDLSLSVTLDTDRSRVFVDDGTASSPSDYLAVPDAPVSNSFTFESWIYPNSVTGARNDLIRKYQALLYTIDAGVLKAQYGSGSAWTGAVDSLGTTISPNVWTHLAIVKSGSTIRVYKNGVLSSTYTKASGGDVVGDSARAFTIGAPAECTTADLTACTWTAAGSGFDGKMSDVRIWNVARTAAEIAATYDKRLASDFITLNLDEPSGTVAYNSAMGGGSALNGIYVGPTSSTTVPTTSTTLTTPEGTALSGRLAGYDPAGDVTFAVGQQGSLGTAAITAATGQFTYTPIGGGGSDSFTYTVTRAGVASDPKTINVNVTDGTPPTISSFSSSTAAGSYKAGDAINITATASEAIQSGDTITATLNTTPARTVTLTAASAGTSLSGTYTIQTGDTASALTVSSFTIGTVADTVGNAMTSTTVPTGTSNIAGAKTIVVDTTAPTVASFSSSTANGSYTAGASINITATTSEAVQSGASLTATLDTGATVALSYATATTLTGTYTVSSAQTSSDLTVSSFTIGSASDLAGNAMTSTTVPSGASNIAGAKAIVIDTTAPGVSSFTSSQATPTTATSFTYTITFAEVVTGIAAGDFANTGTASGCVFNPGSDTSSTSRTVTVSGCGEGTVIPKFLAAGAADTAGNAGPTADAVATSTITRDTTAPTLTLAAAPATATTTAISFTLTGNEPIDCTTVSATAGTDFTLTGISSIGTVTQTSSTVCTIAATSTATVGERLASTLTKAGTFSVADPAGNAQTSVTGSPASVDVTRSTGATPAYPDITGGGSISPIVGTATAIGSGYDITDSTGVAWSSVVATVTTTTGTLTASAGDSGATVGVNSNTVTITGSIPNVKKVLNSAGTAYTRITASAVGSSTITIAVQPAATFTSGGTTYTFHSGNGHYYRVITSLDTFATASSNARADTFAGAGGYLAVVRDSAEHEFVRVTALSGRTEQIRLGAHRCTAVPTAGSLCSDGTNANAFAWTPGANAPAADTAWVSPASSGTQSGWTPWYAGQPSAFAGEVYLSYFDFGTGYLWHDAFESTAYTLREYGSSTSFTAATTTTTATASDSTPPTVASFSSAQASPTNASSVTYTLTFSESVTGVAAGDFSNTGSATGCSFAPGTDSGSTRTVTVTNCSDGTIIPQFAANGASDISSNTGPASAATATSTITRDATAPTVSSFTSAQYTPTNASSITYTLTFAESVTGVAAGDFSNTGSATGCSFAPGTDSGSTRTVTVTSCSAGTIIPQFATNGATDAAGNTGPASAATATTTITRDVTAPTVSSFISAASTPTTASSVTYTLTFSESVTSVAAGDFSNSGTATGCSFAPGTDSGTSRTVTITSCGEGTIIPVFALGGAADAAGNTGPAAAATATTTITRDVTAPTVSSFSSSTANGSYKAGATINVTATTSESVQSGNTLTATLDTGEAIVLTAASVGSTLTGTYTVAAGQNSADLTVSSFTIGTVADTAGNAMTSTTVPTGASNIAGAKAIVIDTTAPTVSGFTSAQASPTNATSFSYTITFDESVTGVASGDFSNSGSATGCSFSPGTDSGTSRTVTITGCGEGTVIPVFASGGATDAAGNTGPASASTSGTTLTIDRTAPTATLTAVTASPTNAASIVYALTFSEAVTGVAAGDFTQTGTATGCVFAPGTDTGATRTVTLTSCSAGTIIPHFAANGATDAAGNTGPATIADGPTITRDTTAPTVSSFTAVTASPTNASSISYALTFSEAVTGVAAGDFTQTGTATSCVFDPGTDSGASRTVTVTGCSAGTVIPQLAVGAVSDAASNTGPASASTGATITIDRTAPTVSAFTSAQASPTNATSIVYTLTFSEAVTGVATGDFSNTGTATGCSFSPGTDSGTSRTVTVSSCSEGTVIPQLALGGATDTADNGGPAAAATSGTTITIDRTAPTATLTAVTASPTNAASIVYTLTFSEAVTGVAAGDFTQTGTATACVFDPGSDAGAIRTVTLTSCSAGTIIPHFAANGATDAAGNTGPATIVDGPTVTRDIAAPTVSSFVAVTSTPTNAATLTYTLAFSRTVTGVAAGDFSNAGTAASCVFAPGTDSGTTRTVTITGCGEGTIIPRFAANGAVDTVGSTGPATAADGETITRDITPPTVASFTAVTSSPTNASTLTFTLTFSDSVTGVAAGDFSNTGTATGCSFAPGADTGSSRTVTATGCSAGTVIPQFAAGGADDLAGNPGPATAATGATIARDVTAPTVSAFTSAQASLTNATSFTYTLTFSEAVTGVAAGDFSNTGTATSCAFAPGTDAGASRTVTITGCTEGTVIPEFAAGGAADAAGNTGPATAATSSTTLTIDRTAPTATLTAVTSSPTNASALTYTLTFSEAVTGVAAGDFSNTGTATGCAFDPGTDAGSSRTVTISTCSNGTVAPRLAINAATDAAGNTGPAAVVDGSSITIDRTAPTVSSFTSAQATPTTAASFTYTLTFSEAVTGVSAGDFSNTGTATGCTFAPGTDTGATRTVTITSCSEGTVTPEFAANGAADAAGNNGPAAAGTASTTIARDVTAPTVASFTAVTASPTNATTLTYTLTFSEAVTGVAAGDFTNTGTATGCAFAPGADTGTTRTVTVTSCSDGTVIPRFAANGATDGANTGPASAFVGDTIVRDAVAPDVSSFTATTPTLTNGANVVYTLTFTKNVTGVAASDFSNTGTAAGCVFNPGTDTGSTRTVTVTGCTDGTVIPRFAANGATDGANTGPATAATGTTVTRDTAAPVLAAIGVSGTEDTTLAFAQSDFSSAYTDARTSAPTSITIAGLPHTGSLRLSGTPVTAGQVVAYADLGSLTYVPAANANGAIAFTVSASDGLNSSSPATTVTMTLAAVNDAPTLATPTTATYTDTTANDTFADATGTLGGADVDTGDTLLYGIQGVTPAATVSSTGTYGTLTITRATGAYVFAPNRTAINARTSDTTETFTVTVGDGTASATAVFTVVITAANDAPTLATPTAITYTDTAAVDAFGNETGTLVGADRDAGATLAYSIATGTSASATVGGVTYDRAKVGTYGTLRVASATGAYVFVPGATAINGVTADTSETFTVRVGDGTATTDAVLTVTITGANDHPILANPTGGTVTDTAAADTFANVTGTLSATDAEGTTPTYGIQGVTPASGSSVITGAYGTLTVTSGGGWTYVPDAAAVNALSANITDAFTVTASDGSLVGTTTLTITIVAVNDTPVMPVPTGATIVDTAGADTFTSVTGAVTSTDAEGTARTYGIDTGSSTVTTLAGTYGTLAIDATNGTWTYTPTAAAINARSANASDAFTVTATDGALTASRMLTISITGANDTPILAFPTGGVVRDDDLVNPLPALTASLSATDAEGTSLTYGIVSGGSTVTSLTGAYGTLSVVAGTGAWTYTPIDAAVRALTGLATDSFTVTVTDGAASSTQPLTVSLLGINNRPVMSAPAGGSLTDTSGADTYPTPVTGNLVSTDPDFSTIAYGIDGVAPVLGVSTSIGTYGTLAVNVTTGTWEYTPNATAVNALSSNATDSFTVTAGDGALTAQRVLSISITATNDRPLLSAVTGPTYTDTAASDSFTNATGTLVSTDAEGTARTYDASGATSSTQTIGGVTYNRAIVGAYGTLRIASATGAYVYVPDATAINALAADAIDSFTVAVSDSALSASRPLVVSITAVDDAPTLTAPSTMAITDTTAADAFPVESGVLSGADAESAPLAYDIVAGTDHGATVSIAGTYGTLAVRKSNGAFTFTPNDAAVNALAASASESFTVRVSDGTLTATRTLGVSISATRETPVVTWADPAAIPYGTALSGTQLNPTAAAYAGGVAGTFTYAEGATPRAAGDVLGVGTHTLVATFTPTDTTMYTTATDTSDIVVVRADQTIVAHAASTSLTYGGAGTTLSATFTGPHGTGLVTYAVASGPCSISGANLTVTGAGTCQVTATIAADGSYNIATSAPIAITVAKATLTVTAQNAQKRVNTADPSLTYLVTGYVGTDNASAINVSGLSALRAVGEQVGTYAIGFTGTATAANYDFAYTGGLFTIIDKDVPTIAWPTPTAITYGTALSGTQLNAVASFGGNPVPGTFAYAIGNTPIASGTVLTAGSRVVTATFTPTDTATYASGVTAQVTLVVDRKPLTVTGVTAADKAFDGSAVATLDVSSAALVGIVGSDAVTLDASAVAGAFGSPDVGANRTVTVSGLALAGADRAQYALTQPTTSATISATVPGLPSSVAAVAGDARATVEWSAPAFTGGSPITGYTVTAAPGGRTCVWTSGPLTCAITGLTNGTAYTFTVQAANAVGTGAVSSASNAVTPSAPAAPALVDENATVDPSGSAQVQVGCAASARACTATVTMFVGSTQIATSQSQIAAGQTQNVALALPLKLQRKLAADGVLSVKVVTTIDIDGSQVRVQSTIELTAPPAQAVRSATLKPNADGSAVVTGQCTGSAVTRCDGTITLYGDPSVLDARVARANERVVVGTAKFAGPAGTAVTAKTTLSDAGRKLLRKRGAVRVTPVMTFSGGTRLDSELAGFTLSMMNAEQWLRRAMATLYVGGQPRMDLNILLDQAKRRVIKWNVAANRIENTIIPQREQARARVAALPTPPPSLQPIVTLLLRAFNQSLQANHAYVEWLRSGRAADDKGWRISLRASATKAQLLARLAKAGAPYGIRVPSATNFWP